VFKQVRNKEIGEVTGNLVGLEREWAIGRQLNLLDEPDGYLPGFMQTGSKVLDFEGNFVGMTLEKLNGSDVLDRFEDPLFNDIDYILNMIMQVGCVVSILHLGCVRLSLMRILVCVIFTGLDVLGQFKEPRWLRRKYLDYIHGCFVSLIVHLSVSVTLAQPYENSCVKKYSMGLTHSEDPCLSTLSIV
jgi:hypothetical protein